MGTVFKGAWAAGDHAARERKGAHAVGTAGTLCELVTVARVDFGLLGFVGLCRTGLGAAFAIVVLVEKKERRQGSTIRQWGMVKERDRESAWGMIGERDGEGPWGMTEERDGEGQRGMTGERDGEGQWGMTEERDGEGQWGMTEERDGECQWDISMERDTKSQWDTKSQRNTKSQPTIKSQPNTESAEHNDAAKQE